MGTPMFAVPILQSLQENGYLISNVYTQPPQKSQRGQKVNKSPIQSAAEHLDLEIRTPKSLKNNNEEFKYFKNINADLALVVAYGQIIPKEFLSLTKKGFINVHASLLPKWRGAAPIQRSIMNLDKEVGISIMKIAEQLDTGPVCNSYKIDLEDNLNASQVAEKLSSIAAEKISSNIDDILEDKVQFIEQDHSKATYASKIQKSEGEIDWTESAKNIIGLGLKVYVEKDYATHLGIQDIEYKNFGVEIKNTSTEILKLSDLITKVNCPSEEEIKILKENTIIIGMLNPFKNKNQIDKIINKKIKPFSLELLPRITRAQSMDVLSSQSNLAGYRAVIDCVAEFQKAVPMMMTAAGTVPAAKVLVIGAGVAGLQAIATAKRLGAIVSATDVRVASKEQVESLGGKFLTI